MAFKSLPSLKLAGIKPSPWIHIVHILIIKPDSCTQVQTLLFGYLGYLGYGDIRLYGLKGLLLYWWLWGYF